MSRTYRVPPSYRARAEERVTGDSAWPYAPPILGEPGQRLKPRQEAFCEHFVATGNATEAARRAGYSARAAAVQGYRLLKKANVADRIRAHQTAIADKIDPALILGRLENLYRLAESKGAYGDAARILVLQGRLMGFDYGGMAAYLISPRAQVE